LAGYFLTACFFEVVFLSLDFFLASDTAFLALDLANSAAFLAAAIFLSRAASFFLLAAVIACFLFLSFEILSFKALIVAADFLLTSASDFFYALDCLEILAALVFSCLTNLTSFWLAMPAFFRELSIFLFTMVLYFL